MEHNHLEGYFCDTVYLIQHAHFLVPFNFLFHLSQEFWHFDLPYCGPPFFFNAVRYYSVGEFTEITEIPSLGIIVIGVKSSITRLNKKHFFNLLF